MAADQEGRELKFYSQFQTEHVNKQNPFEGENWSSYFERSDSFLSFSSPVESEIGSYEIESDKDDSNSGDGDDYTAELSRRMAQYMLQDDDNPSTTSFQSEIQKKSWGLSGSPISTLWSPLGSSNESSNGSPEGPSKEPSPPSTPVVADRGGLDISQNVFRKLEKMKKVSTNGKSIQTSPQHGETGSSSSKDQARALKNQKRKQNQQFMKQKGSAAAPTAIQAKKAQGSSSQANSVAKPGGSSSGTGVFLPRHVNYNRPAPSPQPPQPPKRKGCSTVLIPVRVLQALQLHYDRMDDETRQKITGFTAQREAAAGARIATHTVKNSHPGAGTAATTATSQIDVGLPQEWTY